MIMPLEKRLMLDASLSAVTGQVLWLDAADRSTVVDADGDNASTGTGASNNGFSGAVATWRDKSGTGNNVTSGVTNEQPTYTNTLNGLSVITLDGTNDKLTNPAAVISGNDFTVFAVFNRTTNSGRDALFEIGGGSSRNAVFFGNSPDKISYYLNNTFYNFSSNYTGNSYQLISVMQDVTAISAYQNGVSQISTTGVARTSTTGIYIGDDSSSGDQLQGHIAELIVYNRNLTSDERHDVETYLAGKWGLSITNTAPTVAANTGATVGQGANVTITNAMLSSTDTDNSEGMLQYKITDLSDYGSLSNTNTAHTYTLGEYFTQADVNAGYIRYTHNNSTNFSDSFSFTVSDQAATTAASTFSLTITPSNHAPVIQGWTLVSSEDFQSGATGWSDNTTETGGGTYLTRYLGRHSQEAGAQNTYKTYTLSGAQDYTVITFDMYKIDSWDGEFFRVFINDSQVINLSLTQGAYQQPADGSSGIVSYTVQELTPFAANFAHGAWNDQIFRFTLTVSNSAAANVKLGFSSTLDQAISDESWGVDNVNVYEAANGGVPGPIGIVENSVNGTVVGRITATDQDAGQTISYSIVGGTGASVFSINATTGVITVADSSALNYESVTSYTLDIRATDNGTPVYYDQETVTINVLNLPENTAPTVNTLGPLTVAENAANNTVLGTATGSDAEGNTLTWSITAGNTDNIFAINAATGAIRVSSNTNLNYDYRNTYTLTIQAADNGFGTLTATRNVTVNITNVNEAPTFNIPQSFLNQNPYLRYNAATGNFYQYVGTTANYTAASAAAAAAMLNGVAGHLSTITSAAENTYVRGLGSGALWLGGTDAATEGTWVWGGTGAEGGQTFWLGDATGSAQNSFYTNWLAANPDNSSNEDSLEMQASGLWNDATAATAKAYVIEWEGTAVLAALGNGPFTIAENPALSQSVGFVHARDADAGDTLTYSITGGTGSAHFAVDATTGEITVTNPTAVNYEAATSYTLDLRVQDAGGLFSTQTVTINITDVNETPVLNPGGPFTVTENAANGTLVGTMTASDPDGTALTYSITAGDTRGVFAINNAGQITVARTNYLDYELASTYTITVRVSDGTLTANRNVTINLANVNEAPSFDAIQRVLNSDPTLEYNATTGNFYRFVATTVNYNNAQTVAAAAMLNGVSGYVAAVNSAAESTFLRSIMPTTVWINGSDAAVEGEWRFTSGPDAGELFWLGTGAGSAQNGHYTNWNAGEPNNSGGNEDAIEFRANGTWNDTNITGTRAYIIEWDGADVLSGMDNGPYTINENSSAGTVVGTVAANDPDAGDTRSYSITGGTGAGIFAVNAATGQITLTGSVNYESVSSYTLDLRVEDAAGLFNTVTVTINVNDINETPVLDVNTGLTLNEGGTLIITNAMLRSSDVDTPSDALLVYTVTDQSDNGIVYNTTTRRAILAGETFTQGDIDAGRIRYVHHDGENTSDSFSFRVSDGLITLPAATFNITVNAVNEAPSFDAIQALLNADNALRYNSTTGNFYKYVPVYANFANAQAMANAMTLNGVGGYIAQSNSAAENAYLHSMINASTWIGGSDSAVEGTWVYTGGAEAGQVFWIGTASGSAQNGFYTNWINAQPNNSGNQDRIEMQVSGQWNDALAGNLRPFLVEWDGADVLAGTANGPYDIAENSANNTVVGSAVARDYDAGETLTYSITGGTGSGVFSINATTGQIRLIAPVNYEAVSSYTLNLRVQDSGGLFDTLSITINVLDRNDVPDALSLTGTHILENSPVGTLIGTLATVDQDVGDTHVYTLVTNPGGKFVIVGNEIRTARDVDYEQNQFFTVRIRTDDGNSGILIRNFRINVDDEMDTFTPPPSGDPGASSGYIPPEDDESFTPSANILSASLSDPDGSFNNFYGHQILRENITLRLEDMIGGDLPARLEEEGDINTAMMDSFLMPQGFLPFSGSDGRPAQDYTNLREALSFLQEMADSQEQEAGDEEEDGTQGRADSLPVSAVDRQFVDVMRYHEEKAARLRAALLSDHV